MRHASVRRSQNVVENTADLNWYCGSTVAEDDAPEKVRVLRGGKQQRRRADIGADRVRTIESELVDGANDELGHSGRFQQVVVSL